MYQYDVVNVAGMGWPACYAPAEESRSAILDLYRVLFRYYDEVEREILRYLRQSAYRELYPQITALMEDLDCDWIGGGASPVAIDRPFALAYVDDERYLSLVRIYGFRGYGDGAWWPETFLADFEIGNTHGNFPARHYTDLPVDVDHRGWPACYISPSDGDGLMELGKLYAVLFGEADGQLAELMEQLNCEWIESGVGPVEPSYTVPLAYADTMREIPLVRLYGLSDHRVSLAWWPAAFLDWR